MAVTSSFSAQTGVLTATGDNLDNSITASRPLAATQRGPFSSMAAPCRF